MAVNLRKESDKVHAEFFALYDHYRQSLTAESAYAMAQRELGSRESKRALQG